MKRRRPLVVLLWLLLLAWPSLLAGCAPEFWNGVAQGMASSAPRAPSGAPHKLMLFAGQGHRTYLGCLSCSEYENESVYNNYGPFGSAYGGTSIFNAYSPFGGQYGAYSPCNAYSADPPVIEDEAGNFYGRLTVNRYARQATTDEALI